MNANKTSQFTVNIKPTFMKTDDEILNQQRLDFESKIALVSTVGWIKCPKYLLLNNGGLYSLFIYIYIYIYNKNNHNEYLI